MAGVTFATDLKDLKDYGYVQQIPLEALFKNLGYKQAKYDQGFQQAQRAADSLKVKAYGQDAAHRDQIINEANQQIQKFAGSDFSDPGTLSQFTSYISGLASSPEILGMESRANTYDQLMAKYNKITADGKTVVSSHNMKPINDLQSYFSGEKPYNPNYRVSGDVNADFDLSSLDKKVLDETKEVEEMKNAPNGQQQYYKGQALKALYGNFLNAYQNDPAANRELNAQWEYQNGHKDWGKLSTDEALQKQSQAQHNASVFADLMSHEKDPTKRDYLNTQYKDAVNHVKFWRDVQAQPDPQRAKIFAKDEWVKNLALQRAESNVNYSLKDQKTNDLVLQTNDKDLALRNAIDEQAAKEGMASINTQGTPTGFTPGTIPAEQSRKTVTMAGTTYEAPAVVQTIEQGFKTGDSDFIKDLLAKKAGFESGFVTKMRKLQNGKLEVYIPKNPEKPESKERVIGSYDLNDIYSALPIGLNKEREAYSKGLQDEERTNKVKEQKIKSAINANLVYPKINTGDYSNDIFNVYNKETKKTNTFDVAKGVLVNNIPLNLPLIHTQTELDALEPGRLYAIINDSGQYTAIKKPKKK